MANEGENRRLICLVIRSLQIGRYFTDRSGREQRHPSSLPKSGSTSNLRCGHCCAGIYFNEFGTGWDSALSRHLLKETHLESVRKSHKSHYN